MWTADGHGPNERFKAFAVPKPFVPPHQDPSRRSHVALHRTPAGVECPGTGDPLPSGPERTVRCPRCGAEAKRAWNKEGFAAGGRIPRADWPHLEVDDADDGLWVRDSRTGRRVAGPFRNVDGMREATGWSPLGL